jgi:calcineurin-like phosphoesterase family protein
MDKLTINQDKVFFWSDTHFWHTSAAKHRGFGDDVEAMNDALDDLVRNKLKFDDTLILLGDVSFAGSGRTLDLLRNMKCRKVLVRGNHDKGMTGTVKAEFESVHDILTVKVMGPAMIEGQELKARIVCCHFPMLAWDMAHHGAWHLHGHSHGSARYPKPCKAIDVGVDAHGKGGPLGFAEIASLMDATPVAVFDHHKVRETPGWSDKVVD